MILNSFCMLLIDLIEFGEETMREIISLALALTTKRLPVQTSLDGRQG